MVPALLDVSLIYVRKARRIRGSCVLGIGVGFWERETKAGDAEGGGESGRR